MTRHAGPRILCALALDLALAAAACAQVNLLDVATPRPGIVVARVAIDAAAAAPAPAAFSLRLDAATSVGATNVAAVAQEPGSAALMLCLDRSGSMTARAVATLRDVVLKTLAPPAGPTRLPLQVGIIAFATRHSPLVGLTDDPKLIAKAISPLQVEPEGTTRLYDAMLAGIAELRASGARWKHILVVSDGGDEGSNATDREVGERLAADPSIVVDLIGFGPNANLASGPVATLSGRSKGIAVFPKTPAELARDLQSVIGGAIQQQQRRFEVTFSYAAAADGSKAAAPTLVYRSPGGGEVPFALRGDIAAGQPRPQPEPGASEVTGGQAVQARRPAPDEPAPASVVERVRQALAGVPLPAWIVAIAAVAAVLVFGLLRRLRREPGATAGPPAPPPPWPAPAPTVVDPLPSGAGYPQPPDLGPQGSTRRATRVSHPWPLPGQGQVIAVLHGISGAAEGRRVDMTRASIRLGAAEDNDIVLDGDDFASGHHLVIKAEASALYAVDLDSRNGSDVNGGKFRGATRSLLPGDRLTVGRSTFVVGTAGTPPPRAAGGFEPRVR